MEQIPKQEKPGSVVESFMAGELDLGLENISALRNLSPESQAALRQSKIKWLNTGLAAFNKERLSDEEGEEAVA